MSLPDFLIVTDEQLTQYRHTPSEKWRMPKNYLEKSRNQSVRMYGYVFQNMNERSHGNTLRILLFLLHETTRKDSSLMELGCEKVPNWECLFVHRKQKLFLSVYVDDIKMAGKRSRI